METELLPGWFCIPCHTHPAGGHLGTCLQPPELLQSAPSAGHGSSLVQTGITISSWQCLGNVRTDTHRAGQGGCSKGHFVVQGWGCRPGRTRSSKGHNRDGDREGGDTPLSPPLPARHRPSARRAQGPSHSSARDWEPHGFSCSSQTAPEELSPQLSSGQGQGTTRGVGEQHPETRKIPLVFCQQRDGGALPGTPPQSSTAFLSHRSSHIPAGIAACSGKSCHPPEKSPEAGEGSQIPLPSTGELSSSGQPAWRESSTGQPGQGSRNRELL